MHLLTCKHTVQSLQLFILAGSYYDQGREQWKRHPVLFAGWVSSIDFFWRALLDATRQLLSQHDLSPSPLHGICINMLNRQIPPCFYRQRFHSEDNTRRSTRKMIPLPLFFVFLALFRIASHTLHCIFPGADTRLRKMRLSGSRLAFGHGLRPFLIFYCLHFQKHCIGVDFMAGLGFDRNVGMHSVFVHEHSAGAVLVV